MYKRKKKESFNKSIRLKLEIDRNYPDHGSQVRRCQSGIDYFAAQKSYDCVAPALLGMEASMYSCRVYCGLGVVEQTLLIGSLHIDCYPTKLGDTHAPSIKQKGMGSINAI